MRILAATVVAALAMCACSQIASPGLSPYQRGQKFGADLKFLPPKGAKSLPYLKGAGILANAIADCAAESSARYFHGNGSPADQAAQAKQWRAGCYKAVEDRMGDRPSS